MDYDLTKHSLGFETEHFTAFYDEESRILFVTYRDALTPSISAQFYRWLGQTAQNHPDKVLTARGSIFDFREVTSFGSGNLTSVQRQSQQIGHKMELSNHPVALIAKTVYQQEMLRLTMQITQKQDRKRIVSSVDEALAFINEFHTAR